jgi:hypothetical protein
LPVILAILLIAAHALLALSLVLGAGPPLLLSCLALTRLPALSRLARSRRPSASGASRREAASAGSSFTAEAATSASSTSAAREATSPAAAPAGIHVNRKKQHEKKTGDQRNHDLRTFVFHFPPPFFVPGLLFAGPGADKLNCTRKEICRTSPGGEKLKSESRGVGERFHSDRFAQN